MRSTRWRVVVSTLAVAAATLAPLTAPSTSTATGGSAPPIPPDPSPSTLGLVLEEYAQLPASTPNGPWTDVRIGTRHNRINHIGELPDGSGRLYVPDLNGNLYFLEDRQPSVYLDVKAQFPEFLAWRGLGSGFGFVAFHPEFSENGKFYTTHTENPTAPGAQTYPGQPLRSSGVQSVVTEWTATDPAADTFAGTSRELFRYRFAGQIHAIQQIDFNPTAEPGDDDYGLLYLAVGDGGYGVETDIPQQLGDPSGKILRIDPAGTDAPNGAYGIPDTNPWVGEPGALGEIWAIGMRDPHRFSWDAEGKHDMFLGHIGQRAIEAVYEVDAGDDFGWPDVESRLDYQNDTQCRLDPMTAEQAAKGYDFPVASYAHETPANWSCNADSGHAISGGHVHRGDLPGLKGKYVFGDLVKGEVYYATASQLRDDSDREATVHELQLYDTSGTRMRMSDFVGDGRVDLRFGTDSDRSLYLLAKANGKIWKVVDTERAPIEKDVEPALADDLVASYDFEHPFAADDSYEQDQGPSRTLIRLVNGRDQMRVDDGAYPGSNNALQLHSAAESPTGNPVEGGDLRGRRRRHGLPLPLRRRRGHHRDGLVQDGRHQPHARLQRHRPRRHPLRQLRRARRTRAARADPGQRRAQARRAGTPPRHRGVADLRGLRAVAAAAARRRVGAPRGDVRLRQGTMALYRNGRAVDGFYTNPNDPWAVDGTGTSPTNPRGIKIGGSFPQDGTERNPCNCRMDGLMFLDDAASASEVARQYRRLLR